MRIGVRYVDGVTRENQEPLTLYVVGDDEAIFVVAIDGIGRYWFDTVEEAEADFGDDIPLIYADWKDD